MSHSQSSAQLLQNTVGLRSFHAECRVDTSKTRVKRKYCTALTGTRERACDMPLLAGPPKVRQAPKFADIEQSPAGPVVPESAARKKNAQYGDRTHVEPKSGISLYNWHLIIGADRGPKPSYSGCSATGTFYVRTTSMLPAQIGGENWAGSAETVDCAGSGGNRELFRSIRNRESVIARRGDGRQKKRNYGAHEVQGKGGAE
ncbi:hypothetical protein GGX14DRAFT_404951 [Mycena pura]|uniref:Uncharacterized protein n=1 Tax=Mycena pura TaxID=153505 RepID=A0AAD6UZY9_9AGAR|nr:hypothetical protein GGX14DRAFT_404951 [Mycena pura]